MELVTMQLVTMQLVTMQLVTEDGTFDVEARIGGRVEPVDGRYHLAGRIAPHPEVAALVRRGLRDATLDGTPVRLTEIDPWGGILIRSYRSVTPY